ncbi:hypothetical protein BH11PSE9_BH11PSE9_03060 [soil metagenome]
MRAGPFNSEREAVDAGLRLILCQAAMSELLKWRAKPAWQVEEAMQSRLKSSATAMATATSTKARKR